MELRAALRVEYKVEKTMMGIRRGTVCRSKGGIKGGAKSGTKCGINSGIWALEKGGRNGGAKRVVEGYLYYTPAESHLRCNTALWS